jgi:hypothetical protein
MASWHSYRNLLEQAAKNRSALEMLVANENELESLSAYAITLGTRYSTTARVQTAGRKWGVASVDFGAPLKPDRFEVPPLGQVRPRR